MTVIVIMDHLKEDRALRILILLANTITKTIFAADQFYEQGHCTGRF